MSLRGVCTIAASLVLALRASAQTPTSGEVVAGQTTITLPDSSAYSPAARRILALEVKRSAAIAAHDTAWLATVYAPDFRGVAPDLRFTIDELEVRDFGAAVTVMGRLRTLRGGELAGESRYLHTYIRRGNYWWIVAAAGSAVPPDADRH